LLSETSFKYSSVDPSYAMTGGKKASI